MREAAHAVWAAFCFPFPAPAPLLNPAVFGRYTSDTEQSPQIHVFGPTLRLGDRAARSISALSSANG
jgi:hypothetical protein